MDSSAFDRITRRLAEAPSRRAVLRGLVATVTGAAVAPVALGEPAAAACRKVNKRCRRNSQCCDNSRCRNGRCKCKSGFRNCSGRCRDLNTDPNHCGRCGRECDRDETCVKEAGERARCRPTNGRCATAGQRCDAGLDCCAGLRCRAGNAAFRACVVA